MEQLDASRVSRAVHRKCRQHIPLLTRETQRTLAGDQEPNVTTRGHETSDIVSCFHDLFEVVEQQESIRLAEPLRGSFHRPRVDLQGVGDRGDNQRRLRHCRQVDKGDPSGKPVDDPTSNGQSKTGLAYSPRTQDRDQTVLSDQPSDRLDVIVPPDDRRDPRGQVVRDGRSGVEGWEFGGQIRNHQLGNGLVGLEATQKMPAQRPELETVASEQAG